MTPSAHAPIVAQECPVEFAILTGNQPNRPALPMPSPSYVTTHEVGNLNPGANEDMHRDFVLGGGGSDQVSFHFVCGPTKIIQLIFLNENAWHASDYYGGVGNRDSIAIEHIQIGDFQRTLSHSAWLQAEIFRNPGRFKYRPDVAVMDDLDPSLVRERMAQHNHWAPDKKDCPQFIRRLGLWEPLKDAIVVELFPPEPPVQEVIYQTASLPNWWNAPVLESPQDQVWKGVKFYKQDRIYTSLRDGVKCLALASLAKGVPQTRRPLKKGEEFHGLYRFKSGGRWWIMTKYGTRILASSCSPWISIKG